MLDISHAGTSTSLLFSLQRSWKYHFSKTTKPKNVHLGSPYTSFPHPNFEVKIMKMKPDAKTKECCLSLERTRYETFMWNTFILCTLWYYTLLTSQQRSWEQNLFDPTNWMPILSNIISVQCQIDGLLSPLQIFPQKVSLLKIMEGDS